jgi:hypothetical protein
MKVLNPNEWRLPDRWVQWIRDYKTKKNETDKSGKQILCLSAYDFSGGNVKVEFEDGSTMNLNHAFYAVMDKEIAIFTEHLGYHFFHEDEVKSIEGLVKKG